MDRFFDGTFLTFGIEVISFAERDQEDRIDPMVSRTYGSYISFFLNLYFFPGLYFPQDDKMYISQVWIQWGDRET